MLFLNPESRRSCHPDQLRQMGFVVHEASDWPSGSAVRDSHVIIVWLPAASRAPMLAARLRAKPHMANRLLVALVGADTSVHARRDAEAAGFDDVLEASCDSRRLTARVLRGIRNRPELRCTLPPRITGRPAA